MNIFILDEDPKLSAEYHCNKHVVKMIVESCQLMSTALHELNADADIIPYKSTHVHHPCTIWTAESYSNFMWLHKLTEQLCKEYTNRYYKIHACEKFLPVFARLADPSLFPMPNQPTAFVQAMPDKYKIYGNAVNAYRNYYMGEKWYFAQWKNTTPSWWKGRLIV